MRGRLVARNRNLAHVILGTFRNDDRENHRTVRRAFPAHVLNFHIDIAVVLIPLTKFVPVLFQLHFVKPAGFIEEVNERFAPGFHLFAQHPFAEMRVALEADPAHRAFHAFVDGENNSRRPAFLVNRIDAKLNADIVEASSLINFDDFLARFL